MERTRVSDAIGALLDVLRRAGGHVPALVHALDANDDGLISAAKLRHGLAKLVPTANPHTRKHARVPARPHARTHPPTRTYMRKRNRHTRRDSALTGRRSTE
jgi:hypothetical protein